MKCPSCGADIAASAANCMYCNSAVPTNEGRDHITTFVRLKASDAFAASDSPERMGRLPKIGMLQKAIPLVFLAIFVGGSAFMCIMALGMAGLAGVVGGSVHGGPGAAISIAPLLFAIVPLGFVVIGVMMFRVVHQKITAVENSPARALPVIVVDKRTHVGGDRSASTSYFVTCEAEDGSRNEYQIWDGTTYGKMTAGDAGILFVRADIGLDFDRVRL